jgi:hypothetical protein
MSPSRSRSPLAVALGVVLAIGVAVGAASVGCGPKQKFCPNTPDGVCPTPMDATIVDMGVEMPVDMGSTYIGSDGGQD